MSEIKRLAFAAVNLAVLAATQAAEPAAGRPGTSGPNNRPGGPGVNDGPAAAADYTLYYVIGGIVVLAVIIYLVTRPKKQ